MNAEDHLSLVYHIAYQMAPKMYGVEFDELVSAGTLGLMQALERFDPSKGLSFSTLAVPRIRGAILDDARIRNLLPRGKHKDYKLVELADVPPRHISKKPSIETEVSYNLILIKVKKAITKHLNEQEQRVLILLHFEGLKQVEVAGMLGVTESRISQIKTKAIKKLRSVFNGP